MSASIVLAVFLSVQTIPLVYAAAETETAASASVGIEYLKSQQQDNGSITPVFGGETEWTIVAMEASGKDAAKVDNGTGESLEDFLAEDKPGADTSAGEVERKILAVAASGNDTSNFGGYNYNKKLETYHEDNQIGDNALLNDDYFGIMAVKVIGDESLKPMAQDALDFIISNQNDDNGFGFATSSYFGGCCSGSSVDMTAAAIVAIYAAESMDLVNSDAAKSKNDAYEFLLGKQNSDGGFDGFTPGVSDADSTSWALIALNVSGGLYKAETTKAKNWLIANQANDGSFGFGAYTTPHSVLGLLGTSWLLDPQPTSISYNSNTKGRSVKKVSKKSFVTNHSVILASASTSPDNFTADSSPKIDDGKPEKKEVAGVNSASSPSVPRDAKKSDQKSSVNWGLYGIGLLTLIGLGYFVIESIKAKGAK